MPSFLSTILCMWLCSQLYSIDHSTFTVAVGHLPDLSSSPRAQRRDSWMERLVLGPGDLREVAVLGRGAFGKVTLVEARKNRRNVYALKALLKSSIVADKQVSNVLQEKRTMTCCHHPFILQLFGTFRDELHVYMLLEYVPGGELGRIIRKAGSDGLHPSAVQFYGACVTLGLVHLHNKDIAYRDMKPENCLIDAEGYPKLIDFGSSKTIIGGKSYSVCGTAEYLAPEVVAGRGHDRCADFWSLGVLLFEMSTGASPFRDSYGDLSAVFRNIVQRKLTIPPHLPEPLRVIKTFDYTSMAHISH